MTIAYFTIPIYLLTAIASLILRYPTTKLSFLYATPMLLSLFIPPCYSRTALALLRPIVNYFDFEAIYMDETNVRNQMNEGKNYIFAAQPHGVLSYAGFCAAVSKPDDPGRVPTAVASVLLNVPLLKNLMGIFNLAYFNLVDASASNMKRILKEGGNIKIYIGGIAELFKCCRTEERLYLKKRKGFIKLALRAGVDIIPIYCFGNTSVLSVLTHGPLAALSRKLQASLTLFWGKWYLPIPRDEKLLYVVGKPLGLPHIVEPTQEDIDKWHKVYCDQVRDIFEMYKEKVPLYKHKKLFID
eukprot:CAMPEP_0196160126 /NCGR_PEP_ID=MMETSP0910-20130528/46668_1 /TAXON_ID=49265 /ORGANISM="Thalassiosira rotula, Strain GSO102" /LENGTH=298 /DNA_ID=CAMNT_0041425051 /DNA_START=54 /DNA_END=951 /DNA_ORIENTATION=+